MFAARVGLALTWPLAAGIMTGCGGSHGFTLPPIVLTVTVNENPIRIRQGETVYVPVMVMAPTETVTFSIVGLPGGVSSSYKESESNPSGQLTLIANSSVKPGSYPCTITVGSTQQTASTTVSLEVTATSAL
ncbi:MAG TPA: hypothetical protein VIM62_05450 [Acidobacteriaceae bacterium]